MRTCATCRDCYTALDRMPCRGCKVINRGKYKMDKWRPRKNWLRKLIERFFTIVLIVMIFTPAVALASDDIPGEVAVAVTEELEAYSEEIDMLARLIYTEARGVKSTAEQAGVAWCVLNRVDSDKYPDDIKSVVTQRSQFAYKKRAPIKDELRELAKDVLTRWLLEKHGVEDVGRVLPESYLFFAGRRGRNWFREGYKKRAYWGWDADDPYCEDAGECVIADVSVAYVQYRIDEWRVWLEEYVGGNE